MEQGFPQRLRQMRERRRLSRKALSDFCGLSSGAIRRYERGEAEPRLSSLVAIADFFGCSLDELAEKKWEDCP